ncbi:MAG: hypothetical protein IJD58_09875 [Lachnospiraceae bacterium]|nr:hypothetical protein [Lachnospiraceae bacterium]
MWQIKILSKLELINFCSLNVIIHSKDKKARRTSITVGCIIGFVALMIMSYVGGLSYGFITLGAEEIVPAYIVFLSSLFTLLFCAFKAGKIIFKDSCYDILSSMPIKKSALVISRFIRLYVEGLVVACLIMVPGIAVYTCLVKPGILAVILGILSVIFVPIIPVALSVLLGVIITGISSRMKNKTLFESLCVVLIIVVMLGCGALIPTGENMSFDMEAMEGMANELLGVIYKIYPPAAWFAGAFGVGSSIAFLIGIIASATLLGVVVLLTVSNFESINRRLHTSIAKHDYKLGKLEKKSMMKAIIYREAKGYFSSGTYVMNTIIGPIMAVVFTIGLLFLDLESIFKNFPIDINVNGVIPVLFAGILTISCPVAVSVSMEGREFWIIKTLPVMDKDILKGKLMFSGILLAPFFIVGELIMIIALKPSISNLVWMIVMPIAIVFCTLVMGLWINLKFPKLQWNSDVEVIKQSVAAFLGGFVGVLLALFSLIPVLIVPADFYNIAACGVCIILFIVAIIINSRNNKFDLMFL